MKKVFLVLLLIIVIVSAVILLRWPAEHKADLLAMKELTLSYPALPVPTSGKILLIYAHSDDELGTIAQTARLLRENPGLSASWYIVSDGGRGLLWPGTCEGLTKPECRLSEAKAVAKCAGLPEPKSLNLPDGKISEKENLEIFFLENVPELKSEELAYIFTHDNRGLYGHNDHVSVYDAVKNIASDSGVPLVSLALPEYFKQKIRLMGKAREREAQPITHTLVMDQKDIDVKVCAAKAHASQKLILNLLMFQGLTPKEFFEASPREFLNLERFMKR